MPSNNFALQSNWSSIFTPARSRWSALSVATQRRIRFVALHAVFALFGAALAFSAGSAALASFGIGLSFPGAGFLISEFGDWTTLAGSLWQTAMALFIFAACLGLWLATGNVIAPPSAWLGTAIWSATVSGGGEATALSPVHALLPLSAVATTGYLAWRQSYASAPSKVPVQSLFSVPAAEPTSIARELTEPTAQLMRLILDRALQERESFDGFDRRDQFQTGAIRYQLNFMSYALSLAQAEFLPAFDGYLQDAQSRLADKVQAYRVWSYWRAENAWGNLCLGRDPILRDNIMLSGFVAAQLALGRNATGGHDRTTGPLSFAYPSGQMFDYSLPDLLDTLADGYRRSPYGLQACEPNWIYPLCNMIAAVGLKAGDTVYGTRRWSGVEDRFHHNLLRDFIRPDGTLIAFRSALTGFAPPAVGGAVMQTLPCLFLNSLSPSLARRLWCRAREDVRERGLRRAFWPIDTGNYGLTRSGGWAASAAAAFELGDTEMGEMLLERLDTVHPAVADAGAIHRHDVSVWTHAMELMARVGGHHALARLACVPTKPGLGPRLAHAPFETVNVVRARQIEEGISVVLLPHGSGGHANLRLAGFRPGETCVLSGAETGRQSLKADKAGELPVPLTVQGRTSFTITPAGV
ncbi:Linalool dehydratase/isomerase precursor [Methyloligella halotolerans]|uniref:Linalool dehydratase/isomerase n=1 Tax=Methyloligella halotolerans TaxID=1177755 RepID=A0A1E2S0I4_9HYPH|nr:hypothetical protein [Methyloligella halotolerans]ODA68006.1 Linalool dehydratase/isomerase precursor [Methyloligella halotolerans]